jgi:YD repeat-containing protein
MATPTTQRWVQMKRTIQTSWHILIFCMFIRPASTQSLTRHFFDDGGQLVRALDSNGTLIEYVYDPSGNLAQVNRSSIAPGALSALYFSPRAAGPGQSVTLYGQNFSPILAQNRVTVNGIEAAIIAATTNRLVFIVPPNATAGPISVTVGGTTVSSGPSLVFTPAQPQITSVSPAFVFTGTTNTLTLQGVNLDGAEFRVTDGGATIISAVSNAAGTQATLVISGREVGLYNITATDLTGTSSLSAQNEIKVLAGNGSIEAQTTVVNLGAQSGGITESPSLTVANLAGTPGSTILESRWISVVNAAFPSGTNSASTHWVSVRNTTGGVVLSMLPKPTTLTAKAGEQKSSASVDASPHRTLEVVTGETLELDIRGEDGELTALEVEGVTVWNSNQAGPMLFTVPAGFDRLQLAATIGNQRSETLVLQIREDAGRLVQGQITNESGSGAVGGRIRMRTTGLTAEYFDSQAPLAALPDLTGRTPDVTGFVSALNMPNPGGVFGRDPFGVGMSPDYAARYRGSVLAQSEGEYDFYLTSNAAARLLIDGNLIAEAPFGVEAETASGKVKLSPGWHRIEVLHVEGIGSAAVVLEWRAPGGSRQVVAPASLTPAVLIEGQADEQGRFVFRNVPGILRPLEVQAECQQVCKVVLEGTR